MMCARVLPSGAGKPPGRLYHASEAAFDWLLARYRASLAWALRHSFIMIALTFATVALNVYLFIVIPKGFFPDHDTGRLTGSIEGAQDISFQAMSDKLNQLVAIVQTDPAVESVLGFSGDAGSGTTRNTGRVFISLKPLEQRGVSATQVINRLRGKLSHVPGATLYLQPVQDVRIGGRRSNAQFQFTLEGENLKELSGWSRRILQELRSLPQLADLNSDEQDRGLMAQLAIDRATASRLNLTQSMIDNTLYDAFGQRQVSTIYTQLNQYHVVMEVQPQYWQRPSTLQDIYVRSSNGVQVPLSSFASFSPTASTLAVNHQG